MATASPPEISSPTQKVQVVNFQFCHDIECTFSDDLHLLVETYETELKHENAIALSYAWGDFYRQNRAIGHKADLSSVILELGEEWIISELVEKLALLSMEHKACWMDQICIPQNDDKIRQALSNIPTIYRTLAVVVLMPGHPCKCLREGLEALEQAYNLDADPNGAFGLQARFQEERMRACVNSYGNNSWFNRIWTRQELMYSKEIRVHWMSDEEALCLKPQSGGDLGVEELIYNTMLGQERLASDSIQKLGRYSRLWIEMLKTENGLDEFKNLPVGVLLAGYISGRSAVTYTAGCSEIGEYVGYPIHANYDNPVRHLNLLRFLSGLTVHNGSLADQTRDKKPDALQRFLSQLGGLSMSVRSATKARDYVASVWVDCPGYVLPVAYKTMGLPDLLEDAILQLEKNHGISLATSAPAGIFNKTKGTGLWRPSEYLQSTNITRANQIYGILIHPFRPLALGIGDTIPLNIRRRDPLSKRSREFRELFAGKSTALVFELCRQIVNEWPQAVHDRSMLEAVASELFDSQRTGNKRGHHQTTHPMIFRQLLTESALSKDPSSPYSQRSWDPRYPEIDTEPVMYRMVTDALGLDYDMCKRQGMVLMVSLDQPPCIGLVTRDFYNWRYARGNSADRARRVRTVCLGVHDSWRSNPGVGLHEVVQGAVRSGESTCRVVGVWLPMKAPNVEELGGIVESQLCNSLII